MLLLEDQHRGEDRAADDERATARARLAGRILRHLPDTGDHDSAVPGLSFYRRDGVCSAVSALYEPSLSLVIQGRKRVVLGSETYEYDAGRFILTSVDLPTISQVLDGSVDHPFLSLMLKLDLAVVQEVGGEIDLHGVHTGGSGSGMMIGAVTADLLDAIVRLAALLDTPRDIPVMGRMVLREIVYRLLVGPAGAELRQIAKLGTRCNRIAQVIAWLREHHAEPVRIEDLAEMAAMGVSTFHHHFKAITRMSPLQYQKQIRLHEARRLLLTEPLDAGTAAFRVGYESVTQFSREYRKLFGNPPIRDISLLRGR
jgi:AraC-like DNA-binding protein